ncbi:hypothetical protein D4R87_01155 [bacterium]|nr:MAG: hypothetical protein D4R87_01155 [bacterium]
MNHEFVIVICRGTPLWLPGLQFHTFIFIQHEQRRGQPQGYAPTKHPHKIGLTMFHILCYNKTMNKEKNNFLNIKFWSILLLPLIIVVFFIIVSKTNTANAESTVDTTTIVNPVDTTNIITTTNIIDAPQILPRSTWMTPDLQKLSNWIPNRESFPPDYRPVNRIILHHSAGSNGYPNPISTIQGIYRYHAVSQGWQDIGYNYIIDYNGNIYEGRLGGNGVRGAHVYTRSDCLNFNHGSIGIVLLGNYSTAEPSEKMYESVAKLTGWLAYVNGLDPSQTARRSIVWQDKKIGGTCDNTDGGFQYNYYGPVVVGHKDVGSTQCPGVTSLAKIRAEAKTYADSYAGIFYRTKESSGIYEIKNGLAEIVTDSSPDESMIVEIEQTQLDLFSERNFTKYPDGSILSLSGSIYLVVENFLRRFDSDSIMAKLGFGSKEIMILPAGDKELYPMGNVIRYGPDGKLLYSNETVFYIENGKKRGITSPQLFESQGFNWGNIELTDQTILDSYLDGEIMRYKNDSLLVLNNTVFVLEDGTRRGITSPQLFEKLGYKWENIIEMAPSEEEIYQVGEIKRYPEDTLVMETGILTAYRINNNERQPFTNGEIFLNLGYKFEDLIEISKTEIALYREGEIVKYSDGTLLQPASDPGVYIIENGKKRGFKSPNEFFGGGYKWEDIVVLKQDDLSNYQNATVAVADDIQTSKHTNIQTDTTGDLPVAGLVTPVLEDTDIQTSKHLNMQTDDDVASEIVNNPVDSDSDSTTDSIIDSTTEGSLPTQEFRETSIEYSIPVGQEIRVALKSFTSTVGISAIRGGFTVKDVAGNEIYSGLENDVYNISYSQTTELLIEPYMESCVQCGLVNAIKIVSIDGIMIDETNPFHSGYGGATDNVFIGNIRIKYSPVSKKSWIINELKIDDYVSGVAEVSEDLSVDYLDMMAVVARTYAMFYVDGGGKHAGESFDLKNSLDGNGGDQVYKGYGFASRASNFSISVIRTAGQVVLYENKPILAAYSSDSGGVSKDARSVWSANYYADKPYLWGGVSDPTTTVHNSTLVSASHGVGISNIGAREMINAGSSWEEVVKYYYPGVVVTD